MPRLLILIILTVAAIAVRFGFTSGHFNQQLLDLQRQGSCTDLPRFGVSTHLRRYPNDENVALISEVQAQIVRFDVSWMEVERSGAYVFDAYDELIAKLREGGKSIVLVLDYGNPDHSDGLAPSGFPLPPHTKEQQAAYGRFVRAVAERYHGSDIVYEIWNEPNFPLFWPPNPDVKAYGELLTEASQAIRSVEPTATVISGGLANENNPAEFLRALALTGALDRLNGIAFHPYRKDGPENSIGDLVKIRSAAQGRADLPLWITEWGYSEAWLAKSVLVRQRMATMTARLMLTAALARTKALLLYELIDDGTDPTDQEANFGLYDYNYKPKPAATAFRTFANLMAHCDRYEFKVDTAPNTLSAAFYSNETVAYVFWTYVGGRESNICFAIPDAHPIELTDVSGNQLPFEACDRSSHVRLNLSETSGPVILRVESTASK